MMGFGYESIIQKAVKMISFRLQIHKNIAGESYFLPSQLWSCGEKMRGIPSKVQVMAGDPLPLYRLGILKELIRKVALRRLTRY